MHTDMLLVAELKLSSPPPPLSRVVYKIQLHAMYRFGGGAYGCIISLIDTLRTGFMKLEGHVCHRVWFYQPVVLSHAHRSFLSDALTPLS